MNKKLKNKKIVVIDRIIAKIRKGVCMINDRSEDERNENNMDVQEFSKFQKKS